MQYIQLGKTGLNISRLGFGGIPIQRINKDEVPALIDLLIQEGVNFIDTARGYTVSEEFIGHAIKGRREHFILATKSMSRTKELMEKDIQISLNNFQTDYIDLYQIHNPSLSQLETVLAPGGALEALLEAKESGKIRHIGLTAHSIEVFEKAIDLDFIETIMFPYNIVETQGEELVQKCKERNIGFIDMKPLAGGAIEEAPLALRYLLNNNAISVVIPGMATIDEIKQNVNTINTISPLTHEELIQIDTIRKQLGNNFCRRCNYCAPCSVGINIPSVFLFAGYLERYGLEKWARDRYSTLSVKASDCIGCGICETRCPYHLPIREMLKKSASEFGN